MSSDRLATQGSLLEPLAPTSLMVPLWALLPIAAVIVAVKRRDAPMVRALLAGTKTQTRRVVKLLGAEVRPVTAGAATLKDAMNEALRDWVANVHDTFYIIGTAAGPHPYPEMVRDFQSVIGKEARAQIKRIIEEQAMLRREVGIAQEAEDRAKRLRDEAQDEIERLHDVIAAQSRDKESLTTKLDELGKELRDRLSNKSDPRTDELQHKLTEASKQLDKHKARIAELEQKDATRLSAEGPLRKEVERLTDILKKRDQRELELQAALKPALVRIAELTRELEATRLELAHAHADLEDLKRPPRR